jgi:N-acyl homoserine lactone hydrolase
MVSIYVLTGSEWDVTFTGDAAKNRPSFSCARPTWLTIRAAPPRPSSDLVDLAPASGLNRGAGHDLPMTREDGIARYLGGREAAITAWFGNDLETTTLFNLTVS